MKKETLATIGIVVLILIIAGAIIYSKTTGLAVQNIATEAEAKWIGEHSVVYTQTGCIHCIEQEKLFGNNWKYINSINYDSTKPEIVQAFTNANIIGTPTWVIDGQNYEGKLSIEKLKELTGYKA